MRSHLPLEQTEKSPNRIRDSQEHRAIALSLASRMKKEPKAAFGGTGDHDPIECIRYDTGRQPFESEALILRRNWERTRKFVEK